MRYAILAENGFVLSKVEFHDVLCQDLYGNLLTCLRHAFTSPCGEFPSICHNGVRDLIASLLSEVCNDVEPAFQPVEGEPLQFATANTQEGACLDALVWG